MNTELLQEWVDRLKNGNHKVCTDAMCEGNDTFCAVGVLVDSSKKGKWEPTSHLAKCYRLTDYTFNEGLVGDICADELAHILDCDPNEAYDLFNVIIAAVYMNDEEKKSHKEIGKYVEKTLKGLGHLPKRKYTKKDN